MARRWKGGPVRGEEPIAHLHVCCLECGQKDCWALTRTRKYDCEEWTNFKLYAVPAACHKGNYRFGVTEENGMPRLQRVRDTALLQYRRPELYNALMHYLDSQHWRTT